MLSSKPCAPRQVKIHQNTLISRKQHKDGGGFGGRGVMSERLKDQAERVTSCQNTTWRGVRAVLCKSWHSSTEITSATGLKRALPGVRTGKIHWKSPRGGIYILTMYASNAVTFGGSTVYLLYATFYSHTSIHLNIRYIAFTHKTPQTAMAAPSIRRNHQDLDHARLKVTSTSNHQRCGYFVLIYLLRHLYYVPQKEIIFYFIFT